MASGEPVPAQVGGYILAGGKSSRMGRDKALLELAGYPLIGHAWKKLHRVCTDAHILSSDPKLAEFGPLVPDIHPECGPMGGIEAALAHSDFEWNLILPVDLPFLPTALLDWWIGAIPVYRSKRIRIALFSVYGVPQPALLLIHRDAAPHISRAVARGEFKLLAALEVAAREVAPVNAPTCAQVAHMVPFDEDFHFSWPEIPTVGAPWRTPTAAQLAARSVWFVNLNTREEFAVARSRTDALDT